MLQNEESSILKTVLNIVSKHTYFKLRISILSLPILLFIGASLCWGGNVKGNLEREEINFIKNRITSILVNAGICSSVHDCEGNYWRYYTCDSHDSLSCNIYGITDEKLAREILMEFLNSGLRVGRLAIYEHTSDKKSFIERPGLEFIDRITNQ